MAYTGSNPRAPQIRRPPQLSPEEMDARLKALREAGLDESALFAGPRPQEGIQVLRHALKRDAIDAVGLGGVADAVGEFRSLQNLPDKWKNDAKLALADKVGVGDFMRSGGLKSL